MLAAFYHWSLSRRMELLFEVCSQHFLNRFRYFFRLLFILVSCYEYFSVSFPSNRFQLFLQQEVFGQQNQIYNYQYFALGFVGLFVKIMVSYCWGYLINHLLNLVIYFIYWVHIPQLLSFQPFSTKLVSQYHLNFWINHIHEPFHLLISENPHVNSFQE